MGLLENIEKRERIELRIDELYNEEVAKRNEELAPLLTRRAEILEEIDQAVMDRAVQEFGIIVKALNKYDDKLKAQLLEHGSSVKSASGVINVIYTTGRETLDKAKVKKELSEEQYQTCLKIGKPTARISWKKNKDDQK